MISDHIIDIIVPIYDGFAEVKACLDSVYVSRFKQPFELIVIWDCGPDPQLYDHLSHLSQKRRFTFLENSKNLGFVQTVNRGMQLHPERDVVLLNSDTIVANNWLDRIVACAHTDPGIATVTPFSNNAEICSFPEICNDNVLPFGWTVAAVDSLFTLSVTPAAIDIPTAVGFCMFVRRTALAQLGGFDAAAFDRGYGEENDFCRRAVAQGYRNVHCSNVFVLHVGGVSFGSEKLTRVAHAMRILDERYPDYHALVHEYIRHDPAKPYRIQAALAMLRETEKPIVLILTHNLGGGTERYVADLQSNLSGTLQFLVMRPLTDRLLELCLPWQGLRLYFDLVVDLKALAGLCRQIGVARLHIQHIMGIEASIKALINTLGLPYDITLHDYFFINGNPTLTDKTGRHHPGGEGFDVHCGQRYPVPLRMSAAHWREYIGPMLAGAERVIAPSRFTANLYATHFPDVKCQLAYHFEPRGQSDSMVTIPVLEPHEKLRVVVLGALSLEKGADLFDDVAKLASHQRLPIDFHLVGYAYRPLSAAITTHGPYREEQLDGLLRELKPHCAWFPCQWPETYSYTLSACLRLGLPVVAPDVGAFPERLKGRPFSRVFPVFDNVATWLDELAQFLELDIVRYAGRTYAWKRGESRSGEIYYQEDYSAPISVPTERLEEPFDLEVIDWLLRRDPQNSATKNRKENALSLLMRVRTLPVARHCARLIPIEWQRRLKRRLSSRPLHELTK